MTTEQAAQLMKLCRDNENEIVGYIDFDGTNGEYALRSFKVDNYNVLSSSSFRVDTDREKVWGSLAMSVMAADSAGIISMFHTHPNKFSHAYPSNVDKKLITNRQGWVTHMCNVKEEKRSKKTPMTYMEGVITEREIGFYYYEDGKIKRCPLFVDGIELIPEEPTKPRSFKEVWSDFKSGRELRREERKKR